MYESWVSSAELCSCFSCVYPSVLSFCPLNECTISLAWLHWTNCSTDAIICFDLALRPPHFIKRVDKSNMPSISSAWKASAWRRDHYDQERRGCMFVFEVRFRSSCCMTQSERCVRMSEGAPTESRSLKGRFIFVSAGIDWQGRFVGLSLFIILLLTSKSVQESVKKSSI